MAVAHQSVVAYKLLVLITFLIFRKDFIFDLDLKSKGPKSDSKKLGRTDQARKASN